MLLTLAVLRAHSALSTPILQSVDLSSNTSEPITLDYPRLTRLQFSITFIWGKRAVSSIIHLRGYFDNSSSVVETCTSVRDFTMTFAFLPSGMSFFLLSSLSRNDLTSSITVSTHHNLLTFISNLLWNLSSDHVECITLKFHPIYDTEKLEMAFNFGSDVGQGWVAELLKEQFFGLLRAGNYAT